MRGQAALAPWLEMRLLLAPKLLLLPLLLLPPGPTSQMATLGLTAPNVNIFDEILTFFLKIISFGSPWVRFGFQYRP